MSGSGKELLWFGAKLMPSLASKQRDLLCTVPAYIPKANEGVKQSKESESPQEPRRGRRRTSAVARDRDRPDGQP